MTELDSMRAWMSQWLQDAGMKAEVANERRDEFEAVVRADERAKPCKHLQPAQSARIEEP